MWLLPKVRTIDIIETDAFRQTYPAYIVQAQLNHYGFQYTVLRVEFFYEVQEANRILAKSVSIYDRPFSAFMTEGFSTERGKTDRDSKLYMRIPKDL